MLRTMTQVQHKFGAVVPAKGVDVVQISDSEELGVLVFHPEDGKGEFGLYSLPRHRLLEVAKKIQQILDPTPTEQILRRLETIEAHLREIPK